MSARSRRRWSAREKLDILSEARQSGRNVMDVCRQYQISSSLFYTWERLARQGAIEALEGSRPNLRVSSETSRLEVDHLRALVAELTSENLELRKRLHRPSQ